MLKIDTVKAGEDFFSVDYRTGVVTFLEAIDPSANLSVECEFDIPMRFDTDFLPCMFESYNSYKFREIELIEIKFYQ